MIPPSHRPTRAPSTDPGSPSLRPFPREPPDPIHPWPTNRPGQPVGLPTTHSHRLCRHNEVVVAPALRAAWIIGRRNLEKADWRGGSVLEVEPTGGVLRATSVLKICPGSSNSLRSTRSGVRAAKLENGQFLRAGCGCSGLHRGGRAALHELAPGSGTSPRFADTPLLLETPPVGMFRLPEAGAVISSWRWRVVARRAQCKYHEEVAAGSMLLIPSWRLNMDLRTNMIPGRRCSSTTQWFYRLQVYFSRSVGFGKSFAGDQGGGILVQRIR